MMKNGGPTVAARQANNHSEGLPVEGTELTHDRVRPSGKLINASASNPSWTISCRRKGQRETRSAYPYPASKAAWKKTMQVFHTAGVPPSTGNSIFAIMGSTEKSKAALTKIVTAKSSVRVLIFDFMLSTDSPQRSSSGIVCNFLSVPGGSGRAPRRATHNTKGKQKCVDFFGLESMVCDTNPGSRLHC